MKGKEWEEGKTKELISLYNQGYSEKEIAEKMGITCRTVGHKIYKLHKKHLIGYSSQSKVSSTEEVEKKAKAKEEIDLMKFSEFLIGRLKKKKSLIRLSRRVPSGADNKEKAVLMLSDIHTGAVNKFLNLETGKSEITYNTNIMLKQMNGLAQSVHDIIKRESKSGKIDELYVFKLGDDVENDVIYRGQRFFIDYGVGMQVLTLVELLTDLFKETLGFIKKVTVVSVNGNHGRFVSHRESAPAYNSFDFIVAKMLERVFQDEKRIRFITPESWFYLQKIYNFRYLLHHGDTVYSWMSLPYYGIVRQSKARQNEIPYDIECIGHFHTRMEIPTSSSSYTLVNGGWIPKSDFAWRKFGVLSKPEQYLFGISPKRPRTWSFALDLKGRN